MKRIMRTFQAGGAFGSALLCTLALQAQPVGQWDFKSGDLSATVGSPVTYADPPTQQGPKFGTTSRVGLPSLAGSNVMVMSFPAATNYGGYNMPTPPAANGGGSTVNEWTMIMDVLYPSGSDLMLRPIIDTDGSTFVAGPDFVVSATDGLGSPPNGPYVGNIASNTWYRIGIVVTAAQVAFYVNGAPVGLQAGAGLDGRFALSPGSTALILGTTLANAAPGYIASLQMRDVALNAGQMQALGGPSASGIPQTIPPVPSFIASRSPGLNATAIGPLPSIHVVIDQGDTVVNTASIGLALDGTPVPVTVAGPSANQITVDYTTTNILDPLSLNTLTLVYQDNKAGSQTNEWAFTVANYQNIFLPATPIVSENFDELAEATLPPGWVVTNWTDTVNAGLNLDDVNSDSYDNWVVIGVNHYATVYPWTDDYVSPGFPEVAGNRRLMIPPIVLNGVLVTNIVSGNLIVAESDQRNGSQVQVLFTSDYDLTGKTNTYLSFAMLNEQNQDNISSVEYSIDQGATWLPLLYMLDDGTTDTDGSDVVTNTATGQIDVFATFGTARNDQAHGLAYSNFIGAAVSTNLIPYIRPCRNDDPVQQKRIELFRLPAADGQSKVRFRFGYAGTASWYFDIDNFAIYSINTPVITTQPQSQSVDANTTAAFNVVASGNPPLAYQWKFNGQNIPGATNATYTIANAFPTNAGQYQVIVRNSDGPTKSSIANLTIITTPNSSVSRSLKWPTSARRSVSAPTPGADAP